MNQYPRIMPTLYLGVLATTPAPVAPIDAVWLSFQTQATNKTSARSGDNCFSSPSLAGLSKQPHVGNRSQSRPAASSSRSGHVGSSRDSVVMNVAHAVHYPRYFKNLLIRPDPPPPDRPVRHGFHASRVI